MNDKYKKIILDIFAEKLTVETKAYPEGRGNIHVVSFIFDGKEYVTSSVSEDENAFKEVEYFIEEFYNKPLKSAVKALTE